MYAVYSHLQAYHFFILAQQQLYSGDTISSLKTVSTYSQASSDCSQLNLVRNNDPGFVSIT